MIPSSETEFQILVFLRFFANVEDSSDGLRFFTNVPCDWVALFCLSEGILRNRVSNFGARERGRVYYT